MGKAVAKEGRKVLSHSGHQLEGSVKTQLYLEGLKDGSPKWCHNVY